MPVLPVIDLSKRDIAILSSEIDSACREYGFFVLQGHGLSAEFLKGFHDSSRAFFDLPEDEKDRISMSKAGTAWRGWFPLGGELTSGKKDGKEGIYFGTNEELLIEGEASSPLPLHGRNLYPDTPKELQGYVDEYMSKMVGVAHTLMRCIALALGMPSPDYFREVGLTSDPTVLFRIFQYPSSSAYEYGVGEHTDYGLLTLLCVDDCGGLQVRTPDGTDWIDVTPPPLGEHMVIINLGDMLEKLTKGRYRSTPHRVTQNKTGRNRISFPLFFDPSWAARVPDLPIDAAPAARTGTDSTPGVGLYLDRGRGAAAGGSGSSSSGSRRWDLQDVHAWEGEYGDYLTSKVSKCFPDLFGQTVGAGAGAAKSMY